MVDLTLTDFTDWIKEVPQGNPFQMVVSANQPFAAVLRKADKPTPKRAAELRIMLLWGHSIHKHVNFLKSQFPSLRRAGQQRIYTLWMDERDYALMRFFFGGAG